MTTQSTIDKLIEMRLTSMSDAFLTQLQDARMHIAELIGRVCEAKRPHSVSERSARALS